MKTSQSDATSHSLMLLVMFLFPMFPPFLLTKVSSPLSSLEQLQHSLRYLWYICSTEKYTFLVDEDGVDVRKMGFSEFEPLVTNTFSSLSKKFDKVGDVVIEDDFNSASSNIFLAQREKVLFVKRFG